MASRRANASRKYFVGNMVWVEDSLNVWSPARITEIVTEKTVRLYYFESSKMSSMANLKKIHSLISTECGEVDIKSKDVQRNLVKLKTLSTPVILYTVSKAYHASIYYLGLGPGTVLAINPFKEVEGLFNSLQSDMYHKASLSELSKLPPHIFLVAERALRHMKSVEPSSNQSIIISGESGAGKTWTTCSLMRYFARVCNPEQKRLDVTSSTCLERIEDRILSSNPVLEAFGNAATRRNHNSSRFGKYIKLQYNRKGLIVGATLDVYMLEKTRISNYDVNECSFHIFYQLLTGCTEKEKIKYMLPQHSDFISSEDRDRYNQSYASNVDVVFQSGSPVVGLAGEGDFRKRIANSISKCLNDGIDFEITKKSMTSVGITLIDQDEIFKILSAILHLKQICFEEPLEEDWESGQQPPCSFTSECLENIRAVVELLKLQIDDLKETLTVRKIQAGKGGKSSHKKKRRTVFKHACTVHECAIRRDVLVKQLYQKLFLWIVKQIGKDLSVVDDSQVTNFIGLLDVYGFESFDTNSLEQLCINYANERLQNYYVINFLKLQKDELAQQGIKWEGLKLDENDNCLESLQKPQFSIFSFLNEECRLNRDDGVNHFQNRIDDAFKSTSFISIPKLQKKGKVQFAVKHFAGLVNYSVDSLVFKNRDDVPAGISELIKSSKNILIKKFTVDGNSTNKHLSKGKSFDTVLSQFKRSLDKLLSTMSSTNCHYIRCIKPNTRSLPLLFEPNYVVEQLKASGVVETAQICSLVHPHQVSVSKFINQFSFILPQDLLVYDFVNRTPQEKTEIILNFFTKNIMFKNTMINKDFERWKIGNNHLFLVSDLYEQMIQYRARITHKSASIIQRVWKKYLHVKKCKAELQKNIAKRSMAACVIQKYFRIFLINKQYKAIYTIQRTWRKYRAWKQRKIILKARYNFRNKCALVIQMAWKEYFLRKMDKLQEEMLDFVNLDEKTSLLKQMEESIVSNSSEISSSSSFVKVNLQSITSDLGTQRIYFNSPHARMMRPFLFSFFSSSSVSPMLKKIGSLEQSKECSLHYSKRNKQWYLSFSKTENAVTDNNSILPFANCIPVNELNF